LNVWNKNKALKPLIIPVFIPHAGCPHHCVFCNQAAITRGSTDPPSPARIRSEIDAFLAHPIRLRKPAQISFYGGNFLGLKSADIRALLQEAATYVQARKAESLRFSTRPDTIRPDRLDLLTPFPVTDVELGVQSMNDSVLAQSRRGHTAEDTERAVFLLKQRGYRIGLQMMVGLPGDRVETALETGRRIATLEPDFIRIYPTVVLRGSPLAEWYLDGKYHPMPLEETISLVAELHQEFAGKSIPVIRMGLQAETDLQPGAAILSGPFHPAFGHLVHARIYLKEAITLLGSRLRDEAEVSEVSIEVHPRNESRMRGLQNRNIEILEKMFHIKTLKVIRNAEVPETEIHLTSEGSPRRRRKINRSHWS
jgi:histone acetyltransferase (RNA polymerase elongator complex component)